MKDQEHIVQFEGHKDGGISIGDEYKDTSINFFQDDGILEPVMRLSKGVFYWKGEEVKDVHMVYERFNEWLTNAGK